MGTNDLFTKEIGSALRLGRLRRSGAADEAGVAPATRRRSAVWLDAFMLVLAGVATEAISAALGEPAAPVSWVAFFGALVLVIFGVRGLYADRLRSHLLDEIRSIVSATAVATMTVISLRVVLTDDPHTA